MDHNSWLLLDTLLAVVGLVLLISWAKLPAFLALTIVSLAAGLAAGVPALKTADAFADGVGETLRKIAMIIAFGALLGKMLEISGGAQQLAKRLIGLSGQRGLAVALVLVALLVGLSMFFGVGLVLLIPIVVDLARQSRRPLARLGLPLVAGLSVAHGLVPPHPGPMMAIGTLHADVGKTILLALVIGLPTALISGLLFSWISFKEDEYPVDPPDESRLQSGHSTTAQAAHAPALKQPHFSVALLAVVLPVGLMLLRTAVELALPERSPWREWIAFAGAPEVALLIAVLFSIYALAMPLGLGRAQILEECGQCLKPVAEILLVVAAGGGFGHVLVASGVGGAIEQAVVGRNISPLLLGWLAAAAVRVATGSATVAIATAAGLVAPLAGHTSPELLVLSMGAGSLTLSHVNDGGFWLVKEYLRMSVRQTLLTWTLLETLISLLALGGVMLLAPWVQ